MELEFCVPIFDFNYIGENLSLQDIWKTKIDFHKKFKDFRNRFLTIIYL